MRAILCGAVLLITIPGGVAIAGKPWDSVRVVPDAAQVEGCEYIGEVLGKSSYGGLLAQSAGEGKAFKHLKRNAYEMGANRVLFVASRSGFGGSKYRGEAYLCKDAETAPVPTPTPTPAPE